MAFFVIILPLGATLDLFAISGAPDSERLIFKILQALIITNFSSSLL